MPVLAPKISTKFRLWRLLYYKTFGYSHSTKMSSSSLSRFAKNEDIFNIKFFLASNVQRAHKDLTFYLLLNLEFIGIPNYIFCTDGPELIIRINFRWLPGRHQQIIWLRFSAENFHFMIRICILKEEMLKFVVFSYHVLSNHVASFR